MLPAHCGEGAHKTIEHKNVQRREMKSALGRILERKTGDAVAEQQIVNAGGEAVMNVRDENNVLEIDLQPEQCKNRAKIPVQVSRDPQSDPPGR